MDKVYKALVWLKENHEDYKDIGINHDEMDSWGSETVANSLIDSMTVTDDSNSAEDVSRSGFATEDTDTYENQGDLPITTSAIVDTNGVSERPDLRSLRGLISIAEDMSINVVPANDILKEDHELSYFTAAFPALFPWGTGKHQDARRKVALSRSDWVKLLLKDSSRYLSPREFLF